MVPRKGSSSDRGSAGLGPSEVERSIDAGTDRTEAYGSSGGAGSYAQGGGPAYQRIPLDPDRPGVRQARSLHADRDEDRPGIRRAPGGVGGGVASRSNPTFASISFAAFPGCDPLRELRVDGVLRSWRGKLQ